MRLDSHAILIEVHHSFRKEGEGEWDQEPTPADWDIVYLCPTSQVISNFSPKF